MARLYCLPESLKSSLGLTNIPQAGKRSTVQSADVWK